MRMKVFALSLVCFACLLSVTEMLMADEATGVITNISRGAFQLDEDGTVRLFRLSHAESVYVPDAWCPGNGDKVKVTYLIQGKKQVLEVQSVELVKLGPNSIPPIKNPVTVEIVETGKTGWKAKIPTGQIVKFESTRNTVADPVGLVLMPGQKASIEFHVKKAVFVFGINYIADKIKKLDK